MMNSLIDALMEGSVQLLFWLFVAAAVYGVWHLMHRKDLLDLAKRQGLDSIAETKNACRSFRSWWRNSVLQHPIFQYRHPLAASWKFWICISAVSATFLLVASLTE